MARKNQEQITVHVDPCCDDGCGVVMTRRSDAMIMLANTDRLFFHTAPTPLGPKPSLWNEPI